MRSDRGWMQPDSLAAAGVVGAFALAAAAQFVSDRRGVGAVVLAGYVGAAVVFAVTGSRAARGTHVANRVRAQGRGRDYLLAAAGVCGSFVLAVAAYEVVYRSLERRDVSIVGPFLWVASLAALLVTAIVTRPLPTWPAAWTAERWPASKRYQRVLLGSVAVFLVIGVLARFVNLDDVPLGINADEGDRGASAMSLLSGEANRNLFASGWFYISNVYFWLLAGVMKVLGVGYVQARVLGAVSGCLTLAVVVWIALRHFGYRVALLTAILGAPLGVMLQFSRETTEAAPTALCWALSIAFLLEAARTGATWPWVAAGIAGAFSVYFYPSGRLWFVLAAVACVYLGLAAGRERRLAVLGGATAAALAAFMTVGPFLANIRLHPGEFTLRARQVSVFSEDNASRLHYYDPDWNVVELLWAQIKHSFAIFASAGDGGGFWPTDRPILGPVLTVLVAVGLGWFTLSWRNVPRFILALWFWGGFVGMVVTVETPNLQRLATAVPVLPLLAAGVLDATAVRLRRWTHRVVPDWDAGGIVVAGAVVLLAVGIALQQAHFYFRTYAKVDRWEMPTLQGRAVADTGRDTLAMSLGRHSNDINAGWIRLLAPEVQRGSIGSPASQLPLAVPVRDVAFVLFPDQKAYLPFLREFYPGGSVRVYTHPAVGQVVTVYRISRHRVAESQGSLVIAANGSASRVARLGAVPPGAPAGTRLRWSALLHVPQYWNYRLRVGPGPARLRIDGKTVLTVPTARSTATATVALARGRHLVTLDGTASGGRAPTLAWSIPVAGRKLGPLGFNRWREPPTTELVADDTPRGLVARVAGRGIAAQERIDGALAMCCLTGDVNAPQGAYVVDWRGSLKAPKTGDYAMRLVTEGSATLRIDGRTVLSARPGENNVDGRVPLRAGRHAVSLRYRVAGGAGPLEWLWTPPGGRESIVPP